MDLALLENTTITTNTSHLPFASTHSFLETHKEVLDYLWQQRNLNLNDLREVVFRVYGFQASAKKYKVQFLAWGWRKFNTGGANTPRPGSRGGTGKGSDPHSLDSRKRLSAATSRTRALEDIQALRASLGRSGLCYAVDNGPRHDSSLGTGFLYVDETASRIAQIHGDIVSYLHSCFQYDQSWAKVGRYELLGRCQSMVTRSLAYAVMLADTHTPERFRLFIEIAFREMEKELENIYSSLQMWDLIINVPQLLRLENRIDVLDEYLLRLQCLCRQRDSPLERVVATLLAIIRDSGQEGLKTYITTTAPVWAATLQQMRGLDRTVLNAIGTSMFISDQVTQSNVERLCAAYDELARQAREELGPLHGRTLSQRNAFLNVQGVFRSFLPDFETRSFSLLTKLHRKNAPNVLPADWPHHDRFMYFRTYFRLSEYHILRGNHSFAKAYLSFCDAVPHDLRFRGISMQLGDVRMMMMALKDINQYRQYSCYQHLPDPCQVNSCEELRALMEMSLLQYAIPKY